MTLNYLLDENVDPNYKTQLTRLNANLIVWIVGEPSTPAKGTLDPEILLWCEKYGFVLVTNNRTSMPVHLAEHIAQNRHVPGIFILNPKLSMGQNIDELIFIAEAALENEYQDQIVHLPHTYTLGTV
ncbi:hypothetical protein WA1_38890 [Scytonema hofmannii PCC 7110]|uniref:Uncharacterized protein n=1 Tax=Scytonema hofmannii PCC 7110 TaxID=128403 RepID=A0A139X0S0_9CYAN|nr:DUF5615 family PIN-like protein [Scytonema hofmannii]KYC38301.1 hypothetical protein WA1_38890 [Scytonema hofmannii PCC 7110]